MGLVGLEFWFGSIPLLYNKGFARSLLTVDWFGFKTGFCLVDCFKNSEGGGEGEEFEKQRSYLLF